MPLQPQRFTVTEEHLKLLKEMNIGWQDCEFGAPEVDPKRPYGNSDAYGDIAEHLGIEKAEGDEFSEDQIAKMWELHRGTETALQIAVAVGKFEAGNYEAPPYSAKWRKVE